MDKHQHITRRAIIKALPLTAAISAVTLGSVAVASSAPEPQAPAFDLRAWLDSQTPTQRVNYHQTQLANALCEMKPGRWRTGLSPSGDFFGITRDPIASDERPSVYVQFIY